MDRLQRAFKMLGGVTWTEEGFELRLKYWGEVSVSGWITELVNAPGISIGQGLRSAHEAECILLRAMLDKAWEKWPDAVMGRETALGEEEVTFVILIDQWCKAPIATGPTLFDTLLNALENSNG